AEDEIAAAGLAIGAAFGGAIGVTASSGPGICLKSELINLAVMAELPLVVIDIQRAGPSNGMPTKTEQADLLQSLFRRNGESPEAVLAPQSPADAFAMMLEAVRLSTRYMVPVIVLTDVYLTQSAEPWRVPHVEELPDLRVPAPPSNGKLFSPFVRDIRLARP